ncbi:MAG: aminotransferase class I/II-fold pyridoxal phosphate-dependent enzyme [Gammaproteobacteria bacterium]|nr:aminotransferase class I/II-fold pyridoxal phosphate-dependent enzyme [Gammaproteobacteria bacterium]
MEKELDIAPFHVMDILARCKQMEAQGRDVVHMEIGEPDFASPQPITNSGIAALNNQRTSYTSALGLLELRQAICDYYLQRFCVNVKTEQVIITPGASGALQLILSYVLCEDKKLMICDPTYPCNRNVTKLVGGDVIAVPVNADTGFQLDENLVKENWQDGVAAVLVASPSNPTGTVCNKDELLKIADYLATKNKLLIIDEIYQGLTYGIDSETVAGMRNNIIVINSFSKYFGMTGWRAGWVVAPARYMCDLDVIAQNTYLATSTIAQYAALAAFDDDTIHILEQRREIFMHRRNILCDALLALAIDVPVMPQGAFYVYADISKYSEDSFSFCKQLLEDKAVAITPGCDFGEYQSNQYVRFAYTTSEKRIKIGMQRLEKYLKE